MEATSKQLRTLSKRGEEQHYMPKNLQRILELNLSRIREGGLQRMLVEEELGCIFQEWELGQLMNTLEPDCTETKLGRLLQAERR